jgi:hypothetical protein
LQAPDFTQNFNRYAYCLNNPLIYTDPTGEVFGIDDAIFWGMVLYSAYIGGSAANDGQMNPMKWDWNSGKTYIGVIGGGAVGYVSFGVGSQLFDAGVPLTFNLMFTSTISSMGMNIVTDGKTPITTNFGFGSYNLTTGEFGYIGKSGNSALENIGYGIGTFANISDIWAFSKGIYNSSSTRRIEDVDLATAPGLSSHAAVVEHATDKNLISVGTSNYLGPFKESELSFNLRNYVKNGASIRTIKNVNTRALHSYNRDLIRNFSTKYQALTKNCAWYASRGLLKSGVFLIPQSIPRLLELQILIRNYSQYSFTLTLNK